MHGGERPRLQVRQLSKDAAGVVSVRDVAGKRAGFRPDQGFARAIGNAGVCERLHITPLVKKIRAEQSAIGLFEQNAGIPSVRNVWRRAEAETIVSGGERFFPGNRMGGAESEIVYAHQGAHQTTNRFSGRSESQPFVQRSTLVGFEMAEADTTDAGRIDQSGHGLTHHGKHSFQAGVEQERFIVFDYKMVELKIEFGDEEGDAIDIRGDFCDRRHG